MEITRRRPWTEMRLAAALAFAGLLVSCAESSATTATSSGAGGTGLLTMPDVVGEQLDVALDDIRSTGFEGDVEVIGGGTFGVVVESNWQVCEQSPTAGQVLDSIAELRVDRACALPEPANTSPVTEPDTTPTTDPAPERTTPATPSTVLVPDAAVQATLTVENSTELRSVLEEGDYCSAGIAAFAESNSGRLIHFDGNIAALDNHADYETRFDFLIYVGDYSETTATGPAFQFRDVSTLDLNLTGPEIPDQLTVGDGLRITAKVLEFEVQTCLLLLDPVSTELR